MGSCKNIELRSIWKGKCVYCDKELTRSESTKDHWVPKIKGGLNGKYNYVLSCKPCNMAKSAVDGYSFILSNNILKNRGLLGRLKSIYLTEKKIHGIETQLLKNFMELYNSPHKHDRELAIRALNSHAHKNRLPKNLQPKA